MSNLNEINDLQKNRDMMLEAGWVYAIDGLPGAYIPGPSINKSNEYWLTPKSRIEETILEYSDDEELLDFIRSKMDKE